MKPKGVWMMNNGPFSPSAAKKLSSNGQQQGDEAADEDLSNNSKLNENDENENEFKFNINDIDDSVKQTIKYISSLSSNLNNVVAFQQLSNMNINKKTSKKSKANNIV